MGEARASSEQAWLLPKLVTDVNDALYEVKGKYDIDAETSEELMQSESYSRLKNDMIGVRRVYGWLGYFWWELYQDS